MIRKRLLIRLVRDSDGQSMLETVIVLPVLIMFTLVIMEVCLLANAKQVANYAAFCAARTASVYGVDDTFKMRFGAAMAMSCVTPAVTSDAKEILGYFGWHNYDELLSSIEGGVKGTLGEFGDILLRLASSYVRTCSIACEATPGSGDQRAYVSVDVTYIYHCTFFPLGTILGTESETRKYLNFFASLPDPIGGLAKGILKLYQWNIPIHGRAVMDYWAG
jgi:hypothetical protein